MTVQPEPLDLVLKGGRVVTANAERVVDIGFRDGKVAAIERALDPAGGGETRSIKDLYVIPGIIDIHAHVFGGIGECVDPDIDCLGRGTTTVVDGGTAGANTIGALARQRPYARNRILAWLNLSTIGQADYRVAELSAILHADVDAAVSAAQRFSDFVIGFKARLSTYVTGAFCMPVLRLLIAAADRARLPVMVHVGDTGETLEEIVKVLRPGDVVTHFLTGRRHGVTAYDGTLSPAMLEAKARGVLFDTGRGRNHMSYTIARKAFDAGLAPHTISTDLTRGSAADPEYGMPLMATEMLALGMSRSDVFAAMTINGAKTINRPELGVLAPGSVGDATVLKITDEPVTLTDPFGVTIHGSQRVRAVGVVLNGAYLELPQHSNAPH